MQKNETIRERAKHKAKGKRYDEAFKQMVRKAVFEDGMKYTEASKKFGVSTRMITYWMDGQTRQAIQQSVWQEFAAKIRERGLDDKMIQKLDELFEAKKAIIIPSNVEGEPGMVDLQPDYRAIADGVKQILDIFKSFQPPVQRTEIEISIQFRAVITNVIQSLDKWLDRWKVSDSDRALFVQELNQIAEI